MVPVKADIERSNVDPGLKRAFVLDEQEQTATSYTGL